MSVTQKVAWLEVIVSLVACVAVLAATPILGGSSIRLFGLLGAVIVIYPLLLRHRGNGITRDERDFDIARTSDYWGCSTAWMFFVISVIAVSMWHNEEDVPTIYLSTLIWIQFAIFIGVRGATALLLYRGAESAA